MRAAAAQRIVHMAPVGAMSNFSAYSSSTGLSVFQRHAWFLLASAAYLSYVSRGVLATQAQLLEPVVWHSDVAQSFATGLAYNSISGVLYQVGFR